MEGGLKLSGVGLHRGYLRALGARVVSSAIWFVADVPQVGGGEVGTGTTVEVMAGGSLLEWMGCVGWIGVLVKVCDWPVVEVAE